jgi:hypothetical protein
LSQAEIWIWLPLVLPAVVTHAAKVFWLATLLTIFCASTATRLKI